MLIQNKNILTLTLILSGTQIVKTLLVTKLSLQSTIIFSIFKASLKLEVFYYSATGGSGDLASVMLQPGEVLAEPAEGLPITAAGYADGLFHIQLCRGDASRTDNHAFLWMEDADGREFHCTGISYFTGETAGGRTDYMDFLFAVPPEDLAGCTLHGNFYTAATLTEGLWQVTFPLENTD